MAVAAVREGRGRPVPERGRDEREGCRAVGQGGRAGEWGRPGTVPALAGSRWRKAAVHRVLPALSEYRCVPVLHGAGVAAVARQVSTNDGESGVRTGVSHLLARVRRLAGASA